MYILLVLNKYLRFAQILILLLVLFLSGGVLFAKDVLDEIQIAPFMRVTELSGGAGMIPGLRVKTFTFETEKDNKGIVAYYKKLWKGQIKSVEGTNWFYHSNYNGEFLTVVQVKKRPKGFSGGSNVTNGIISISEPNTKNSAEKEIKVEVFYPLTPGTKVLSDLFATDMGRKSRTTVLDVPGGVSTNLIHYKLFYERKGWKEAYSDMAIEMVKNFGGASLVMQNGSDELVLSFIPDDNGRTKLVGVYVDK